MRGRSNTPAAQTKAANRLTNTNEKLYNDSRNRFKDRTQSISNNNFNTIQTNAQDSTQAHSTSNFGGRKLKTNRSSTRNNKIDINTKRSHIIDSYGS